MNTKAKLIHAVTRYDARQSRRPGYNHNALAIYFERVDEVCTDIEQGADVRAAVVRGFTGRLADACLKELGLPRWAAEDNKPTAGPWHYTPVSKGVAR